MSDNFDDAGVDGRIRDALHAAANQITPESLPRSTAPTGASVTHLHSPSRARWMGPVLAAAAVAAVIVGTVAVVTSSPNASGPRIPVGGSTTPSVNTSATGTAPSPVSTTVVLTPVQTPTSVAVRVCGFSDVPGCSASSYYVPLWPFANYAAALSWAKTGNGSQPWHLDAGQTALNFTRGYLGFTDITTVTSSVVKPTDAHVGVGYRDPNGKPHTAAVLHLVRYGSTDAGWEVVGSDDTDFTLVTPKYASQITQVMTVGGTITGVDENVVVRVRMQDGTVVNTGTPSVPAGGQNTAWKVIVTTSVPNNGRESFPLALIAFTGGHLQQHERFAIQGVYV